MMIECLIKVLNSSCLNSALSTALFVIVIFNCAVVLLSPKQIDVEISDLSMVGTTIDKWRLYNIPSFNIQLGTQMLYKKFF